eukprot:11182984-Lingulodinium_polyedra.AAC.1
MMRSNRNSAAATARKPHVRASHARTACGARMEYASVRFVNRCGNRRSIRPHRCAMFGNAAQQC